jgi:predicted dehydrogenase
MKLKALVVGYGSVGARHARVLEKSDATVAVVSRRGESGGRRVFPSLDAALAAEVFDYVVIADETARHGSTLAEIAQSHTGNVLIEKPLFAAPALLPAHRFARAGVGYNLRFHPVVDALQQALNGHRPEMADLHVGQWLGDWRPARDTTTTYSSSQAEGGGALRDLSHELDLATWLFGPWRRVAAIGGRFGNVTVDSDDSWGILLACERCPLVTLRLDYLDRTPRRTIAVHSGGHSFHADLIAGTLSEGPHTRDFPTDRDQSYIAMHDALLLGSDQICTLAEGLQTVMLIDAIERAARERRWIEREAA